MPTLVRHAIAGWQASGIFVAQSGTPITILDDNAGAVYGNYPFENRAQLSGTARPSTSGSLYSRVIGPYLNPAAFTSAPEAPNGTSSADTDFGNSGVGWFADRASATSIWHSNGRSRSSSRKACIFARSFSI